MKTYKFHQDSGHGWLAVKRMELVALGILHKVSAYSYQRGETVYLEEDSDASLFLDALANNGRECTFKENYRDGRSPIRNYEGFTI